METTVKLSGRLLDALAELGRHEQRTPEMPFWWRKASMEKLVALGLTEPHFPAIPSHARAYRLTAAGKLHLSGFPDPSHPIQEDRE